jgi:hypothetical protein
VVPSRIDWREGICIAQAATGADLTAEAALSEIAERLLNWLETGATDVGGCNSRNNGGAVRWNRNGPERY